ncbi:MAG: CHAT domain-containing protein [Spirulina sp.]
MLRQNFTIASPIVPEANSVETTVVIDGNRINIQGGTLSGDGQNLFHSFEQFGVSAGQVANFLSAPSIRNILGRVTGGHPSILDGLIKVAGGNSNLFLMNPAGIIFGANASLNVPGDFTATTATRIGFGGTGWFDAFGRNNYRSLIGNPTQFAFDLEQPAAIVNHGNLTAQNLTLLGGSVTSTGTLQGTNIIISAVPGENLVRLSKPGHLLNLELPRDRIAPDISPLDIPRLLTGDPGATNISGTTNASNAKGIGGQITILGETINVDGHLNASGQLGGGNIFIGGDYLGRGKLPTANYTNITDSSTIRADAIDQGDGGQIIIWSNLATNAGNAFISARGGINSGDGGFIETSGKEALIFTGNPVLFAPQGRGGTWVIDPSRLLVTPGNLQVGDLSPAQIAEIESTLGESLGTAFAYTQAQIENSTASAVLIFASNDIVIMNGLDNGKLTVPTDLFVQAGLDGTGGVYANSPIEANGSAEINAPGSIQAQTLTTNGGDIILNAGEAIATGNLTTNGGNIAINNGAGEIRTGTLNTNPLPRAGGAGNIDINSAATLTIQGIEASGLRRWGDDGGNVKLTAVGNIEIFDRIMLPGDRAGNFEVYSTTGDFTGHRAIINFGNESGNTIIRTPNGNIGDVDFYGVNFSTSGNPGGNVELVAGENINIGSIDVRSFYGEGGNVTIDGKNITTGNISTTGATGNGAIALTSQSRITGETFKGGEINIDAVGNIDINGIIDADNLTIFTQNSLNIYGIQTNINYEASIISQSTNITTGTPLNFGIFRAGESTLASAIYLESKHIFLNRLSGNTSIGNFIFELYGATPINPNPVSIPMTPITITPTIPTGDPSFDFAQKVANTLNLPLTIAGQTTNTITYNLVDFDLELPRFFANTPDVAPSDSPQIATFNNPIQAIEQIENRFTQTYLETYPEIEDREAIDFPEIRRTLDTIFETTGQNTAILYVWWEAEGLRLGVVRRDRDPVVKNVQANHWKVKIQVELFTGNANSNLPFNGKNLSDMLISPIADELTGLDTILFSLDDGLRHIPVAALLDNEDWLIKKYNLATIPSVVLIESSHNSLNQAEVLAMGATEFADSNLAPLPFVQRELDSIAKYRTGNFLFNQQFTPDKIKKYPAQIVHLATHATYNTLNFYNTEVTVEEFARLTEQQSIELLVLSGCDTARDGGGREMAFAGLAARTNVDSAIASRWRLNDGATALLMELFYKHLESHPKAKALRLAKLEFVKKYPHYSHPYYWAGLGLVGFP